MKEIYKKYPTITVAILLLIIGLIGGVAFNNLTEKNPEKFYQKTVNDSSQSYEGVNLFANRNQRKVFLMHNNGSLYHTWNLNNMQQDIRRFNYPIVWNRGDLIYTDYKNTLARFDKNSTILWRNDNLGHHDAGVFKDNLLVFSRENTYSDELDSLIQDGVLKRVSVKSGEVIGDSVSLYNITKSSEINLIKEFTENLVQGRPLNEGALSSEQYRSRNNSLKLFHANSISVLKKDYDNTFQKGRILLSLRNIDMVVLLDWEQEEIVWHSEVDLDRQHHPTMTKNGNVLIFDNGWERRDYSRVIEINSDSEIVWGYTANPRSNFHSSFMGSSQELPNGNILITESMKDRAFEINKQGEIVWELDASNWNHGGIFRLTRFNNSCLNQVFKGKKLHSRLCN